MNYLEGKRCYLSGPIQHANDGPNWRIAPTKTLTEEFKINLFDPFADPKQQHTAALMKAKQEKDIDTIRRITKKFVRKDLTMVDHAHLVIAYLPQDVRTTGTVHEIITSSDGKKPTLLVTDQNDITCIPLWYFGFINPEFMFPNWNALFIYLRSVNRGEHRENDRWSVVYGDV